MATFMIGYDLNKEGAAYSEANKKLTDKIKEKFGSWWHHLDSTWIVKSDMSAKAIRNALSSAIDSDDELLVAKLSGEAAWSGFNDKGSKWLSDNL